MSESLPVSSSLSALALFTGSATGTDPRYAQAVAELGRVLAGQDIEVVYGGGKVGLMGVVADAALEAGGTVTGVIPQSLMDAEVGHPGLSRLEVVASMHERKRRMAELSTGFVALPGGIGTLEEFFEVWTWQNLGLHAKPVALYDVAGFWQPLLRAVEHLVGEGFLKPEVADRLIVAEELDELLEAMRRWRPTAPKWGSGAGTASSRPQG